jgi:hypothetical protein
VRSKTVKLTIPFTRHCPHKFVTGDLEDGHKQNTEKNLAFIYLNHHLLKINTPLLFIRIVTNFPVKTSLSLSIQSAPPPP